MEREAHLRAVGPRLTARLLGRMEIGCDGLDVRLAGRQAQALLALLILRPRPRAREAIAADLWPEADGGSAASLRQALWVVRSAFIVARVDPGQVLENDADVLGLRPGLSVDLDAVRFEACLRDHPPRAEEAVALYGGDLAEGLAHECFAAERERLADAYEDALALVAQARLDGGDLGGAHDAAEQLLLRDPLREEAHAVLIEVYGREGTRSQVIRQWRRLQATLRHELDVEPLPETDAIYRRAVTRTFERSALRVASAAFSGTAGEPAFVGRD